ncbi:MAG: hypothetical protein ABSF29_07595, partial [Tepidisphaeraceae bacterium]
MIQPAVIAVASMLHEPPGDGRNSAQRQFRGQPVLAWTLSRISRCANLGATAILCWQDQRPMVESIATDFGAQCFSPSARIALPKLDSITISRRWSDGWRGGLLAACDFDRGFHAPWIRDLLSELGGQAACLIDPAAALVDPYLIDALIDHAAVNAEVDFFFTPAAPGLSGVLIRKTLLDQLALTCTHPGALLGYRPDVPQRDPISTPACAPVAANLARTTHRLTLDSDRQIALISQATDHLNGQLISSPAEHLLHAVQAAPPWNTPREIVLELTPRRHTRPIYWPGSYQPIDRPDLSLDAASKLFEELSPIDDLRLIL